MNRWQYLYYDRKGSREPFKTWFPTTFRIKLSTIGCMTFTYLKNVIASEND